MYGNIYIYKYLYVCTFGDEESLIEERTAKEINTSSALLFINVTYRAVKKIETLSVCFEE